MSFVFSGLRSIGIVSRTKVNTASVTQSQLITQATSISHPPAAQQVNEDDISSINVSEIDENDIVSDEEEENDGDDDGVNINNDSLRYGNIEGDSDYDNVSTITSATKKKLDADIQREVWNIGLEQLANFPCPCKEDCTQRIPVGHVVHARRSLYGLGNITALMRRKAIFNLLSGANKSPSHEFRYITLENSTA